MRKYLLVSVLLLLMPNILFCIGFALNTTVESANRGTMPVAVTAWNEISHYPGGLSADKVHAAMTKKTHLKFLADWIQVVGFGTASPGDLFLFLSDWYADYSLAVWLGFNLALIFAIKGSTKQG